MSAPVRILNLFTIMNRGGAETMCMNLFRHVDREKLRFDFLVYYDERGDYDSEIESLGGKIYHIPHLKFQNLGAHIHGARQFFQDHPEYQIVHDHMGENGAFICREAAMAGVRTIIYHSHFEKEPLFRGNIKKIVRCFVNALLYKIARPNCNQFFACGTKAAGFFTSGEKNVHILKNAIDVEHFQYTPSVRTAMRNELGLENSFVIGNVARFEIMKNHKFLLAIFKEVVKKAPEAKLLLVGDGSFRNELTALAEQYGILQSIIFTGVRQDVNRLLQAMDVFVFPSIREGLPVSCIEAQAAGLPCLFSDGFDHETAVTGNCHFLSLKESAEKWADTVLSYRDFQRQDTGGLIRAAGYDIAETSEKMEKYYIACSEAK